MYSVAMVLPAAGHSRVQTRPRVEVLPRKRISAPFRKHGTHVLKMGASTWIEKNSAFMSVHVVALLLQHRLTLLGYRVPQRSKIRLHGGLYSPQLLACVHARGVGSAERGVVLAFP